MNANSGQLHMAVVTSRLLKKTAPLVFSITGAAHYGLLQHGDATPALPRAPTRPCYATIHLARRGRRGREACACAPIHLTPLAGRGSLLHRNSPYR
jgi:hypothetical protein